DLRTPLLKTMETQNIPNQDEHSNVNYDTINDQINKNEEMNFKQKIVKFKIFENFGCSSEMIKVSYLGICFMILFTAYDVTENSLSSIFSDLGYYSLGIVYFSFALSSLFAPRIIRLVGAKISLAASSVT